MREWVSCEGVGGCVEGVDGVWVSCVGVGEL